MFKKIFFSFFKITQFYNNSHFPVKSETQILNIFPFVLQFILYKNHYPCFHGFLIIWLDYFLQELITESLNIFSWIE